jgi:hypothetical protein
MPRTSENTHFCSTLANLPCKTPHRLCLLRSTSESQESEKRWKKRPYLPLCGTEYTRSRLVQLLTKPFHHCTKPHPTIHWASTKKGIGRGLELLSEDGRLRGGASQWRNRLRETEGSVAGYFFE